MLLLQIIIFMIDNRGDIEHNLITFPFLFLDRLSPLFHSLTNREETLSRKDTKQLYLYFGKPFPMEDAISWSINFK